ncbi:MAG: hypothetical protein WED07_13735 [Candidatus Freyarchaeum deiterrae]
MVLLNTNLELADFMPKYLDQAQRYNNWYFTVSFSHKKKEYMARFSITEGTLMGQKDFLNLSMTPLRLKQEKDVQVLKEPTNDIAIINTVEQKDFQHREEKDKVIIETPNLTAICKVDERKLISKNENLGCELTFKSRGPPTFWGEEKYKKCEITEGTGVSGIEALCNVQGSINVEGEPIEVNGMGLSERTWIDSLNFLAIRMVDWIYANFDQAYMFLCHVESNKSDGCLFHFETGTVYMMQKNEYLPIRKLEVTPEKWAYQKSAYRFIPLQQKVKVKTDKGDLEMDVALNMYPQTIEDARRIENLTLNNITGWNAMFYDSPVAIKGKFTYKNGKTVELDNGRGMNETLRIVPL